MNREVGENANLEKSFKDRLSLLFCLSVVVVGLIVLRLLKVQIFDHSYYASVSNIQYYTGISLPARRGLIFDRNGRILVTNRVVYDVGADPLYLRKKGADLNKIGEKLAKIFGGDKRYYLEKLNDKNKRFVLLVKDAPLDDIERFEEFVDKLGSRRERDIFKGIIKIERYKRYYPYDRFASHVLGVVNKEGEALAGIELKFDKILRGKDGFMRLTRDALGDVRAIVGIEKIKPIDGYSLKLSIDVEIQMIIESELERAVKDFEAENGVVIVIDPWTGDVLGLANYPNFDPNNYWSYSLESFKNRAIVDAFEPGSTFKIVPASLLLEKKPSKLYSVVNVDGGRSVIRGVKIIDFKPSDILNFREILKYSSNIGIAKLALELDKVDLYRHIKNLGFGTPTGIDLPGETRGEVKTPDKWSPTTKVYMSFGYELRATALQIAMAYASIANGGILIKPRVIKEIIDSEGKIVKTFPVVEVRRVMSEKTAKILTDILEEVVNEGTGIQAKVDGLRVAGKTGTAQMYEFGFYSKSRYRASFVGFFPANKPKYVCFVILESPKKGYAGGVVAAPVFRRIAEQLSKLSPVEAEQEQVNIIGAKNEIISPLKENEKTVSKRHDLMPDLRNLSLRSALEKISHFDVIINIVGSGIVVDQQPKPGVKVTSGMECTLYCRDVLKSSGLKNEDF